MFTLKKLYFLLFLIGTALPIYLISGFIQTQGFDFSLALNLSFANQINAAWSWDVIVSSTVFFVFVLREMQQHKMPWWPLLLLIPMDFILGLCCAFPAFLFWRESYLMSESEQPKSTPGQPGSNPTSP